MWWTVYIATNDSNSTNQSIQVSDSQNINIHTGIGNIEISQNPIASDLVKETLNTCFNKEIGLLVEKPDANWFCVDLLEMRNEYGFDQPNKYFLGGIAVGRNSGELVLLVVYDNELLNHVTISEFIDMEIESSSKLIGREITILNKQIVDPQKYAIFEGETMALDNSGRKYAMQIYQNINDKLYMIQYGGDPPDIMHPEIKEEIRQIMKSFRGLT